VVGGGGEGGQQKPRIALAPEGFRARWWKRSGRIPLSFSLSLSFFLFGLQSPHSQASSATGWTSRALRSVILDSFPSEEAGGDERGGSGRAPGVRAGTRARAGALSPSRPELRRRCTRARWSRRAGLPHSGWSARGTDSPTKEPRGKRGGTGGRQRWGIRNSRPGSGHRDARREKACEIFLRPGPLHPRPSIQLTWTTFLPPSSSPLALGCCL
jgi:hypothetical protein